jgi:voltage-dependent potassium channel beta subunit
MKYRRLGDAGIKVSELSLGGWLTFGGSLKDQELAQSIITAAYDSGINFFDIADVYAAGESEKLMGSILKNFPRHTLVISSKVFWPMSDDVNDRGLSRKHIMESVHKSLQRIGTDYLDLYFCHRFDEETPVEETVRVMDDLIHQGKILYWGTSEWSAEQIQEALNVCERYNLYKPQVEQPHYSMLYRERVENEILPVTEPRGMGLVVFSPLETGMLTGKYDDGVPEDSRFAREEWLKDRHFVDAKLNAVRELKSIADELGVTRAQLALAWTLRQSGVSSAITGATKVEQIIETLPAIDISLDDDVLDRIDAIMEPVAK